MANEWISVTEALPPVHEPVDTRFVEMGCQRKLWDGEKWRYEDGRVAIPPLQWRPQPDVTTVVELRRELETLEELGHGDFPIQVRVINSACRFVIDSVDIDYQNETIKLLVHRNFSRSGTTL